MIPLDWAELTRMGMVGVMVGVLLGLSSPGLKKMSTWKGPVQSAWEKIEQIVDNIEQDWSTVL